MNSEYNPRAFSFLFEVEEKNFWFKNRRELIYKFLLKYIPNLKGKKMLEIGCGCGNVLAFLNEKGIDCEGSDIYPQALKFARKRTKKPLYQFDVKKIPFKNKFDIIGLFDVLEHIKEEKIVIKNIYRALKPGGYFILTFPAFFSLWSETDQLAFHKKRYTLPYLEKLLASSGFRSLKKSYFMSFLLPLFVISRKRLERRNLSIEDKRRLSWSEFKLGPTLNRVLYMIAKIEHFVIVNLNIDLPLGSSGIFLVQK